MMEATNLMGATVTWMPAVDRPGEVRHITTDKALADIHGGTYATQVDRLRTLRTTDPVAYKEKKTELLPAVTFHGKFTRRADKHIVEHSGLLCMDFDNLPTDKLPEIRAAITADPHVFALFLSPSGEGLKVLVPIPPDPERHAHHFDALRLRFDAMLAAFGGKVKTDTNARALSQACLVSHDPDLYKNPDAQVFDVPPPSAVVAPHLGIDDLSPAEVAQVMRDAYRLRDGEPTAEDNTAAPILATLLDMVEPVDFRAQANLPADKAPKDHHHLLLAIANVLAIAQGADRPLAKVNGTYWIFNGRHWQPLSMGLLRQFLGDAAERMGVDHFNAKFYGFKDKLQRQFDDDAAMEPPPRKMGVVKINLANGTFIVKPNRQELREVFDPADFMTYQLPFAYDPDATCPTFHTYLDRVMPDRACQAVLAEFMGFVFVPHKMLPLEYALLLHGSGHNGKSVFANVMTALLGKENTTAISLEEITKNPNARLGMEHKLVNIATEINTRLDPATFKAMCSGEAVQVKQLYSDIRDMTNYGKMVFLANELPREVENTDGFFRRLLLVPFTVSIPKEEWDLGLVERITANELPGVFNWLLDGLRRLWTNRKFTHAQAVDDAVAQYRERSDSVLGFIRELALEPTDMEQRPLKELYAQYVTHCKDGGHRNPLAIQNFADRLRKNGFTVRRGAGGANVVLAKAGTIIGNDNKPF